MTSAFSSSHQTETPSSEIIYTAKLRAKRSLGQQGFLVVMVLIASIAFFTGFFFFMLGAWPVIGFMGLDVALIWWAFKTNYKTAHNHDNLIVTQALITLQHVSHDGQSELIELNPFWARLDITHNERHDFVENIGFKSHGRLYSFGEFLAPLEKKQVAHDVQRALYEARNPSYV